MLIKRLYYSIISIKFHEKTIYTIKIQLYVWSVIEFPDTKFYKIIVKHANKHINLFTDDNEILYSPSLSYFLFILLLLLLLSRFGPVRLCATPEMATHQAPPSLGFSRQEHWSGLPFPSLMHESEKWKWSRSVVSDSSRPHGLQPTRLLCPWDFLGKSTGVGCHCLLRFFFYLLLNRLDN